MKYINRDKRYLIPTLSVDIFDALFCTTEWDFSGFKFSVESFPLTRGMMLSGSFASREIEGAFGLFDAEIVAMHDLKHEARFLSVSYQGKELLRELIWQRQLMQPSNPDLEPVHPELIGSLTRRTINWSLSGALLEHFGGPVKPGDKVRGLIRANRLSDLGFFTALVIRVIEEPCMIAVKFIDMQPETFEFLENAMKKSNVA